MNNNKLSNVVTSLIETVIRYNRSTSKSYNNIQHIMKKEIEIIIPYDTEEYIFNLNDGWKIINQNNKLITIKKI